MLVFLFIEFDNCNCGVSVFLGGGNVFRYSLLLILCNGFLFLLFLSLNFWGLSIFLVCIDPKSDLDMVKTLVTFTRVRA